jgi:aryl-alcohol dehydrogenase-like predicted oxidoreductase
MEQRRLGRLGHTSSVLIFGGAALSEVTQEVADRSIQLALHSGINHFDQDGRPNRNGGIRSIRRSIERLQVTRVDLVQLHSVGAFDDLDRRTASGGALEGVIRARQEGLVAAIGITGHGMKAPAVHLEALRRFPFDTVLTPYNYRLTRYPEFLHDFEALVEEVHAQDAGLMLIKAVARNLWRAGEERRFATWYEPLDEQSTIDAAMAFALGRREATGVCTAGDVRLLPMQIEAEQRIASIPIDEAAATLERVPDLEPPFVRAEGRVVPEWLEPLLDR